MEGRLKPVHGDAVQLQDGVLAFDEHTAIMGVINVTDDSFSGDGLGGSMDAAIQQAGRFAAQGADILDIGAESTRPGSHPVAAEHEIERTVPLIERLQRSLDIPLSIDTQKPQVALSAIEAGADLINDVNGLRTEGMIDVAADTGVPVIIMHMQGSPRSMQEDPRYDDVIDDIKLFFYERIEAAVDGGIDESQIILDPGFGFGKTVAHNLTILQRLREFRELGRPMLIGTSRKSTIGHVLNLPVEQRLFGTAATCAASIINGADMIRVHDVKEMVQVARMTDAILKA